MKFTMSRDKIERAEIKISIRLSREEVAKIHKITTNSIPEFLHGILVDGLQESFNNYDVDYEDQNRES